MIPVIRFLLLFISLLTVSIIFTRKIKIKKFSKSKRILIYFIIISIIQQISKIPLESLLIKYDSANMAFSYLGKGELLGIEEGEHSCLVITENNSEQSYIYLNKDNNYLKTPFFKPHKKVVSWDNGAILTLFQEKETQNYYVVLLTVHSLINDASDNSITDNQKTVFHRLFYQNEDKNNYFYLYSAYVENIDEDNYYVKINDNEYKVFD